MSIFNFVSLNSQAHSRLAAQVQARMREVSDHTDVRRGVPGESADRRAVRVCPKCVQYRTLCILRSRSLLSAQRTNRVPERSLLSGLGCSQSPQGEKEEAEWNITFTGPRDNLPLGPGPLKSSAEEALRTYSCPFLVPPSPCEITPPGECGDGLFLGRTRGSPI